MIILSNMWCFVQFYLIFMIQSFIFQRIQVNLQFLLKILLTCFGQWVLETERVTSPWIGSNFIQFHLMDIYSTDSRKLVLWHEQHLERECFILLPDYSRYAFILYDFWFVKLEIRARFFEFRSWRRKFWILDKKNVLQCSSRIGNKIWRRQCRNVPVLIL